VVTSKQLAANRLNATRSTGPRTAAGKATAAKNAVKHGIYAHIAVLPALGETASDWTSHRDAVVAALEPVGKVELDLVERYAHLSWRLVRATKYEAATATVALLPAAALMANPVPAPDGPCEGLLGDRQVAEVCTELVAARRTVEAIPKAIAILTGLDERADDEPVDPEVARRVWRQLCEGAGLPPGPEVRKLLQRFWTGPAGTRTGCEPDWEYTEWTVGTVRTAVAFLATGGGFPPDRLATLTTEALAEKLKFWKTQEEAAEAAVGRAVGARQAAAVEAAMRAVGRGPAGLELGMRYEAHLTREMEAVLRQFAAVRALREARGR
jgi:hypothetical protein